MCDTSGATLIGKLLDMSRRLFVLALILAPP